jgi:hypothetical protein
MYARSGGRMLVFVARTYAGYHRTYVGPPDVCYFLENPLDNTWMYEAPFGPMCTDHRTYARVAGRPLLCQGVGGEFSL